MSLNNAKQCQLCRKPFLSFGGDICDKCLNDIEVMFATIKDYLYDHPERVGVRELSEKTEVPQKVILHLMREGRILIEDNTAAGLSCKTCGAPISSGTMCEKCKSSLAQSLDSVTEKPKAEEKEELISKKDQSRMHVQRNKDDRK